MLMKSNDDKSPPQAGSTSEAKSPIVAPAQSRIVVPEASSKHIGTGTELTMLIPIRPGFVPVVDTRTYATRLRIVFKVLQGLRTSSREARLTKPILDIVDAAQTVHAFTWAILGERQLLLSVYFDRPWEPYIRLIWKNLGPLMDLFLCNCADFTPSAEGFDRFTAFVRRHQVDASFFYPGSALTMDDQRYLVQYEKAHRDNAGDFDTRAATLTADGPLATALLQQAAVPDEAALQWLAVLEVLYGLRNLYPEDSADHEFLRRAAHALLDGSRPRDGAAIKLIVPSRPAVSWFDDERLAVATSAEHRQVERREIQAGILEPYKYVTHGCLLLARIEDPSEARRFISQLADETKSEHRWRITRADEWKGTSQAVNIAFSAAGLKRIGVPESDFLRFPKEFREGMEARAGLLGDVRENHPERWSHPQWNVAITEPAGHPVNVTFEGDLVGGSSSRPPVRVSTIDIVFTLSQAGKWNDPCDDWNDGHPLHADVHIFCADAFRGGIRVVSVQPTQRLKVPAGSRGATIRHDGKETFPFLDHFGFLDGLSNPKETKEPRSDDPETVATGDFLVGFQNERGDPPFNEQSTDPHEWTRGSLLDGGSFLVVRKLREHVKRLRAAVGDDAAVGDSSRDDVEQKYAKMMGRSRDGKPLISDTSASASNNNFTFSEDPQGAGCPFHAHIRRANPRLPASKHIVPRIARRSLAYGPPFDESEEHEKDRGIMFMAYNASIAEQFEALQRWMSAGNTPGADGKINVYGGQPDPFVGLADSDGKRAYRFLDQHGAVKRMDLGKDPFVSLQWGLYLFAPSIAALARLGAPAAPAADLEHAAVVARGREVLKALMAAGLGSATSEQAQQAAKDAWAAVLEDIVANQSGITRTVFAAIQADHGGVLRTPYGVLVTSRDLVLHVLNLDPAFSVHEYQRRFAQSVGESYLGLDRGSDYDIQSAGPNGTLDQVSEEDAFAAAIELTRSEIEAVREDLRQRVGSQVVLKLEPLVNRVLAGLAKQWFDIPDGVFMTRDETSPAPEAAARCPFHFLAPSRYVFSSPNPRDTVSHNGADHGKKLLHAVQKLVETRRGDAKTAQGLGLNGPISKALLEVIPNNDELFARTLLGLTFGFVPTVYGNALSVLGTWLSDESLWRVQQRLLAAPASDSYQSAGKLLRPALERAMLVRPVPQLLHRKATTNQTLGNVEVKPTDLVVLAMSAATNEALALGETKAALGLKNSAVSLVFGGNRANPDKQHPTHACPGQHIAMGVLLGMLSALLNAGTLTPTPILMTVMINR